MKIMNEEQRRILDYLNNNAVGYANRKSSTEIRDALNLDSGGPTNEHVRDLIRDMIFNHGCLIGSDNRGYWVIETKQELQNVIDSLNSRAEEINERAVALRNNWKNRNE